jgi:hypothetical protein
LIKQIRSGEHGVLVVASGGQERSFKDSIKFIKGLFIFIKGVFRLDKKKEKELYKFVFKNLNVLVDS